MWVSELGHKQEHPFFVSQDLVQTKKRWKCGEKECCPLWMNCFTISCLLGSGNVRSGDLSSHRKSHRVDRLQCSQGRYAQPHTALTVRSGFPWKTLLSPVSPPSPLGSHSTCAQSPPRKTQLLARTKDLPCCATVAHYQGTQMMGESGMGRGQGGAVG